MLTMKKKRIRNQLQNDFKAITDYVKEVMFIEHQEQAEQIGMGYDKFKNVRRGYSTPNESDILQLIEIYSVTLKDARIWARTEKKSYMMDLQKVIKENAELKEKLKEIEDRQKENEQLKAEREKLKKALGDILGGNSK